MNYFAIDTSNKSLTVLVCKDGKVYTEFDAECGVDHSVQLMPKVEQLCERAKFDLSTADFFACVVGAGSFTGIRIGVATVKAMCLAYKKPCLSITSFDTLAYNEIGGKVLALIDAKHNAFYACGYSDGKVDFQPSYIMRDEALKLSDNYTTIVSQTKIDGFNVKTVSVSDGLKKAIEQKINEVSFDLDALNPLYVRKSQAEEGR